MVAKGAVLAWAGLAVATSGCSLLVDESAEPRIRFSLEAEEGVNETRDSVHNWLPNAEFSGFSGTGYMEPVPEGSETCEEDELATCGAVLRYDLEIERDAQYYVHVRVSFETTGRDSLHWGIDDAPVEQLSGPAVVDWHWKTGAERAQLVAGSHVFNLWMRETLARVDAIELSLDPQPPDS